MQSRVLAILIAVVLALVATAALVVYVNGADRRAISGQQPVRVWVAKERIAQGTSGEDAQNQKKLTQISVPRSSVVKGVVVSPAQLEQRFAAVDIAKGEQLLLERWVGAEDVAGRRLLQIPVKHQALSIGVDLTRQVAGFVTPGDLVSMVLTMPRAGGEEPVVASRFLLQNVQVLAVGATALPTPSQSGGGRVAQGKSQNLTAVTLAIHEKDVERVVYAAENGSIYLTLMPPNAENTPGSEGDGVDGGNVVPPVEQQ